MVIALLALIYCFVGYVLYRKEKIFGLLFIANLSVLAAGSAWFKEELVPAKTLQNKYLNFGKECRVEENLSLVKSIYSTAKERGINNFMTNSGYPLMACFAFRYSDLPVASLRIVNFTVHLLLVLFAYLIYCNLNLRRLGVHAGVIAGVLPSFFAFDLIIIRDLFIVFLFSLPILGFSYFIKNKALSLPLILSAGLLVFFRAHLMPSLLFMAIVGVLQSRFRNKGVPYLLFGISFLMAFGMSFISLPFSKLNLYLDSFRYALGHFPEFLWKGAVEMLGFAFLLPGKILSKSFWDVLLQRAAIFDSLVVPLAFVLLLVVTFRERKSSLVEGVALFPMILYYIIYFYMEHGLGHHLPYSFRISLPFHYLMAISLPYLWDLWRKSIQRG